MFTLIFSGVFAVVAIFAMGIGALKAKKTVWQLTVTRIVLSVISAILAALVSSLIAWHGLGFLVDTLLGSTFEELLEGLRSGKEIITALLAMIVAPMLFLPLYAIIKSIAKIFAKMIARPFRKLTAKKVSEKAEAAEEVTAEATAEEAVEETVAESAEEPAEVSADEAVVAETAEAEKPAEPTKKDLKREAKELKKAKKYAKKHEFKLEKSNWLSALCGALCGLVTLCILMIPAVGTLGIVNDIASLALDGAAEADESGTVAMVSDVLDGAANNAGSVTVKIMGGQLVYDMMTTYKVGGESATLRDETGFVKSLTNALMVIGDDEADKTVKADALRGVSDAFSDSSLMPVLISEITSAAADNWRNGEPYAGIEMPSMGDLDPIMMSVVDAFAQGNVDTIKEDLDSIIEIFAVLVENDAMESFGENPLIMLSKEETTSRILKELLENPRLNVMVDGLSDFGISMLMSSVGVAEDCTSYYEQFKRDMANVYAHDEGAYADLYAEVFDDYGLRVSEEACVSAAKARMNDGDITAWIVENIAADDEAYAEVTEVITVNDIIDGIPTVTDNEAEANALAHAFAVIYGLTDDMGSSSFEVKSMLAEMGRVLDSFAATETYGQEKTAMILKAMLQSEMVHDEMGFSLIEATDAADSITKNAASKGYVSLLNSLALVVDAMEASSNIGVNNVDAVKSMLNDLTPESAEVLASITTPKVLENYGVPTASAKPVSDLMGNTFNNLADAKAGGMSDEEYAKESAAVSNMMSMVMDSGDGAVFGEGSSTGVTASEFISDIRNSQVMSQTLVETVYGDGDEASNDPLQTGRSMGDEEKAEFVNALNDQWESSDKSPEDEKEITAIAAIMNIPVEITVDGVDVAEN